MLALFAMAGSNAVVLQPVANMYSRASADADVVSQAIYGANVGVIEEKDGWAHIRTADALYRLDAALLADPGQAVCGRGKRGRSAEPVRARISRGQRHAPCAAAHDSF